MPDLKIVTDKQGLALASIMYEYHRAREKHGPMASGHEGYAVSLEELDELWDAVKADDLDHARAEAIQVGAMALAFLLEVCDAE